MGLTCYYFYNNFIVKLLLLCQFGTYDLFFDNYKERLNITSYEFPPNSFFFLEKDSNHRLCLTDDLQLELKEFSRTYNGNKISRTHKN